MLLTIGMIVKNEEKYLERCLNGIKPILEQVDSELIIADTGSTDRTVEIARKFTDNVFYFEWIKDFAAARNSTLEKARGEWFMFVDADEIFEGCDEIIHFFNSGEYKKYNSASYIVRNLPRDGRKNATDFIAPRLTYILPATSFIHPVHECFNSFGEPIKYLDDVAIHYGYSADTGSDEEIQKFKRNSELLLKRLEEEKPSAMLYSQLYDCFVLHDEKKALGYLQKGIAFSKEIRSPLLPSMYQSLANYWFGEKNYSKTLEICREYFDIIGNVLVTDIEMHGFAATSFNCMGRCAEAVDEYRTFFEKYTAYKSGRLVTDDVRYTRLVISGNTNITALFSEYLHAAIISGKYSDALELAAVFPVHSYPSSDERISTLAVRETELLARTGFGKTKELYNNLNDEGRVIFSRLLRGKIAEGAAEADILAELPGENCELVYIYNSIPAGDAREKLKAFSEKRNMNEYADILYYIIRNRGDISDFISLENVDIGFCVSCCVKNFRDFFANLNTYGIQNIKTTSDYGRAAVFFGAAARFAASVGENADGLIEMYNRLRNPQIAEMMKLSAVIKSNIRNYIDSGNIPAAEKTLAEYEKINPNDPEIGILRAEIK